MSKKQQPKNSFYFFMKNLQNDFKAKGYNYNMSRIAEIAAPQWKDMTKEERYPYEMESKNYKQNYKKDKLDCTGKPLVESERELREERAKEDEQNMYIRRFVSGFRDIQDIVSQPFYFVSTLSFGQMEENKSYFPAEIGITKYSISEGITIEYHEFIHPGEIPLGYRFKMKDISDRSHNIPPEKFDLANENYCEIIEEIYKVIGYSDGNPVLFCNFDDHKQTEYILNELLMSRVPSPRRCQFKIYDVSTLFCSIYSHFGEYSPGVVRNDWLRSSAFMYKPNTCCKWHYENENYCCALGNVKSCGYIFSDYLCEHFQVVIIPGQHLPIADSDDSQSINQWQTSTGSGRTSSSLSFVCSHEDDALARSSLPNQLSTTLSICSDRESVGPSSEFSWSSKLSSASKLNDSENLVSSSRFSAVASSNTTNSTKHGNPWNKTFASAITSKSNPTFELDKDDFPELDASSESSASIDLKNWGSVSSVASYGTNNFSTEVRGRGLVMKKPSSIK